MDRPRIRVDFNELIHDDVVLLSKADLVIDSEGREILLSVGLPIFIYEFNHYDDGMKEYLLADGIAQLYAPEDNDMRSSEAKWCCRINADGIRNETT